MEKRWEYEPISGTFTHDDHRWYPQDVTGRLNSLEAEKQELEMKLRNTEDAVSTMIDFGDDLEAADVKITALEAQNAKLAKKYGLIDGENDMLRQENAKLTSRCENIGSAARGVMHFHSLDECDCVQCSRVRRLAPEDPTSALADSEEEEG